VGRPNYNQYAGGVTLPDPDLPPATNNRITVNNAAIKAWSAQTAKVRLEYYFEGVGQVSVGAFRREFENFFGATIFPATAEFLTLYGLDPALYGAYDVSTQHNVPGTVRMTGLEFDYKQALTFLPQWARGLQVFANASTLRATGDDTADFAGYVPRSYNWGISLSRQTFNVRANWNYRGSNRQAEVTGRSIESGTFTWGSKQLFLDIQAEYYLRKRFAVFANLRNVGDATNDTQIYGPSTPEHAQFRQRTTYGSLWSFGVKGSF
jgi:outer membrane receptor for ferrienterochelin and colicin